MFENLDGLLTWVISGGGGGVLAYWVLEQVGTEGWDKFWKRVTAFGLAAFFALLAYGIAVIMGYEAGCVGDWRCWVEQCVTVALTAITTGQAVHGAQKLKGIKSTVKPPF